MATASLVPPLRNIFSDSSEDRSPLSAPGQEPCNSTRPRMACAGGSHRRPEDALRIAREIMTLVASGLMSKQIAAKFELSEITVKVHRSQLVKKMDARTVAELVRMAKPPGVPSHPSAETERRASPEMCRPHVLQHNGCDAHNGRNLSIVLDPRGACYLMPEAAHIGARL